MPFGPGDLSLQQSLRALKTSSKKFISIPTLAESDKEGRAVTNHQLLVSKPQIERKGLCRTWNG